MCFSVNLFLALCLQKLIGSLVAQVHKVILCKWLRGGWGRFGKKEFSIDVEITERGSFGRISRFSYGLLS